MSKKVALLSVYEKKGIEEFAEGLVKLGWDIVSTGGTAKLLRENKIPVKEVSELTGFPEILDGRVKTLHPKVFAGLLSRRKMKTDIDQMEKLGLSFIDLVAVNLYPFEDAVRKYGTPDKKLSQEIIENIDIGGVALLRASAKNFEDVLVVCSPDDYSEVLERIKTNKLDFEFRRELASKAFSYTAYYDSIISEYFTIEQFPEKKTLGMNKISSLRYGENPHQKASVYRIGNVVGSVVNSIKLQGKELSYNNYLDLDSAWNTACEFEEPACVIVKHNNPCGVASGDVPIEVYKRALTCDPVSAFGGIIAFNCLVDKQTAEEIIKLFTECIIAPDYSEDALKVFSNKKDLRVLKAGIKLNSYGLEYRTISGGILVQDKDVLLGLENIKPVTERKPTQDEIESLKFAWKVCKNVKSNTIVLARGKQTVGIGAGQMSRIDALRIAVSKMNSIEDKLQDDIKKMPLVLASDAFFPFGDVPEEASKAGVSAIIQPGGSLRDEESISVCNKNKIAMVFTGVRHFRH